MCPRLCLLILLVPLVSAPCTRATGLFEGTLDIGGSADTGGTEFLGYAEVNDKIVPQYLLTARSGDTQLGEKAFHFAYRRMTGECRVSASFDADAGGNNSVVDGRGICGVMIRACEEPNAVYCFIGLSPAEGLVRYRCRRVAGAGVREHSEIATVPLVRGSIRVAVQRVMIGGEVPAIEGLLDRGLGHGWERVGPLEILPTWPTEVLIGVAVGSEDAQAVTQAIVSDVQFRTRVERITQAAEIPLVSPAAALPVGPDEAVGFNVRSIKAVYTKGWGREQMNRLLDFGCTGPVCFAPGMPFAGAAAGERIVSLVNLYDTGGRGEFSAVNGYPDESFPGIDPLEVPSGNPAGGDDDDHFATEVKAAIRLTAGLHIFGASHDDGVYFFVGGIQIGWAESGEATGPSDFLFEIAAAGWYELIVRSFETEGQAQLELHEVFRTADGRFARVLLGDLAHGASPVLALTRE